MIYLDNAATTKTNKMAFDMAAETIETDFYNPSSIYAKAVITHQKMEIAKKDILSVCANPKAYRCIITSGGTEANNTAILNFMGCKGNVITSVGEHSSVAKSFEALENYGVEVRYAKLKKDGTIDLSNLYDLIDDQTKFVSIMDVNNEVGAINSADTIAGFIKQRNRSIIVHSDFVQSYGKLNQTIKNLDMVSVSAHKIGGLKGIGALFVRNGITIKPLINGGGQEYGLRSGTENFFAIKQFQICAVERKQNIAKDFQHFRDLRNEFIGGIDKRLYDYLDLQNEVPYIVPIIAKTGYAETILHIAASKGVIIGAGSACSSNQGNKASRVITAMGYSEDISRRVLRISFSPKNTIAEVKEAVYVLNSIDPSFGG